MAYEEHVDGVRAVIRHSLASVNWRDVSSANAIGYYFRYNAHPYEHAGSGVLETRIKYI